jgi:hypothetical protein
VKFSSAANGRILETLTSGLYDGNSNCIREYVQNAIDSGSNLIEISYGNDGRDIIIRDYGCGMDKVDLNNSLLVGRSEKKGVSGGWRGIGIYSGVPNFSKIYINTRKSGALKCHVTLDCDVIRMNYRRDIKIEDLLELGIPGEIEEENDPKFKEGTQVILSGILRNQMPYFKEKDLLDYLIRTLPLKMKKSPLSLKVVKRLEEYGIMEPSYIVKFKGEEIFRPPLDDGLFEGETLSFTPFLKDNTKIAIAWSVYSKNKANLKGVHRGIIFKKKGYSIGGPSTVLNNYEGSYNYWQYGEIHVLDEEILESSARNNFEINSGHTPDLLDFTAGYINNLQQNNRKRSRHNKNFEIDKVKEYIGKGDVKSAEKVLKDVKIALTSTVKGAALEGLKGVAEVFEKERKAELQEVQTYYRELEALKKSTETSKINDIIEKLPPKERADVREVIFNPESDVVSHWMSEIEKKIKEVSGLKGSEFKDLVSGAFGTCLKDDEERIKKSARVLLFDPTRFKDDDPAQKVRKAERKASFPYYVTAGFGSLLYELYNLFVNGGKHHRDLIQELWFGKTSAFERANFYAEFKTSLMFLVKIIEKTVPNPDFEKKGSS